MRRDRAPHPRGRGEGVPFDEIAILLRSAERHQPLVAEALRRAGIPGHYTHGTLRPDAAGRSFLALLYCAEEGLSASRFAEYLSLGQMPEDEEPPTPAVWERLLVDAAVIGGAARWASRLRGLREEFHRRYQDEQEEAGRASLERNIAAVENLERLALPVIARLAALPAHASWGEWMAALIGLAESTLREPERVVDLLEELEPMSEIGPVALSEVLLVLGPRLNALRAAPKDSRYGKVWVSGIEEARGLAFRRVFVPGVNEGLFPRPPAEDPLLLEAQRRELGIELRAEDTELLCIAAACASERLSISFSRLDLLTGRERVPSFYAFAAHRAAGGGDLDVREFEERARAQTGTRIGWPAPADPADAHRRCRVRPGHPGARSPKAPGQYLKSLPGRAVDSLRARWARWHKPWKAADGLFIEEIGSDALDAVSAAGARLVAFGAAAVRALPLSLRAPRHSRTAPGRSSPAASSAWTRQRAAQLYHAVQFELLRDLSARGASAGDRGESAGRAGAARRRAAERRGERGSRPGAGHPADLALGNAGACAPIFAAGCNRRPRYEADWTPEFYELSFGLPDPAGRDPRSRKEPVELSGGFQLQGSIDLVERHRSGVGARGGSQDRAESRIRGPRWSGGGEVLQPALYALAAEKMLGEPVAIGPPLLLHHRAELRGRRCAAERLDAASRRAGAARSSTMPCATASCRPRPRKDGCKRCEYLPVCGPYEEERVAREIAARAERR